MGKDDLEVRREDQDKINKFSRLHQREMALGEELKVKAVWLVRGSSKHIILGTDDHIERQGGSGGALKRAGTGRRGGQNTVRIFNIYASLSSAPRKGPE